MPIEELLALYNCVSPGLPTIPSIQGSSGAGSSSRRLRSRNNRRASRRSPSKETKEPAASEADESKENIRANEIEEKEELRVNNEISTDADSQAKPAVEKQPTVEVTTSEKENDNEGGQEIIGSSNADYHQIYTDDEDGDVEEESDLRKLYPEFPEKIFKKSNEQRLYAAEEDEEDEEDDDEYKKVNIFLCEYNIICRYTYIFRCSQAFPMESNMLLIVRHIFDMISISS